MCYSAQVWEAYQKYLRVFGADIDILEFARLYGIRNEGGKVRIPLAMDHAFAEPKTKDEREVKALIDAYVNQEKTRLEQEMFQQKQRPMRLLSAAVFVSLTAARLPHLSRLLRASNDLARRMPDGRADALPVPAGEQASVLRQQIPRHL